MFKILKSLFRRRQPVEIKVVHRDVCRLTLDEWRKTPDLVKMASGITTNQAFQLMLDVLRNQHLANWYIPVATTEQRAQHQLRAEGYNLAMRDLVSLAQYEAQKPEIVSEFEADDIEQRKTA